MQFLHLDQKMSGLQCLIQGKSEVPTDECYVRVAFSFSRLHL